MGLFKNLFSKPSVQKRIRSALAKASTPETLLVNLDSICTENEIELRRIEMELTHLEHMEVSDTELINSDELTTRQRKLALQRILRIRKQIKLYDDKADIHTKSINLLQHLMAKIQLMQSMAMQGVEEAQIDTISLVFQEHLEHYRKVIESSDASEQVNPEFLSSSDSAKMKELITEITEDVDEYNYEDEQGELEALEEEFSRPQENALDTITDNNTDGTVQRLEEFE